MEAQGTPNTPANGNPEQAAPQAQPNGAPAAQPAGEAVDVRMPDAGRTETVVVVPGVVYHLDADKVAFSHDGNNLVATDAAGGKVVFEDYFTFASGDLPPELTLNNGAVIPPQQIVAQAGSPDLNAVEPAAGTPAAVGGGKGGGMYTAYDPGNIGAGLNTLALLGDIDMTFGGGSDVRQVAPTDLAEGSVSILVTSLTSAVTAVPGGIVAGSYSGLFEDNQPNGNIGDTTTATATMDIVFTPADNEVVTSTTLTGFPVGMVLTLPNGTSIAITTADQIVTIPGGQETAIAVTPPPGSDADFTVTAVVHIADGAQTADITSTITVIVDAVADVPTLHVVSESTSGGYTDTTYGDDTGHTFVVNEDHATEGSTGGEFAITGALTADQSAVLGLLATGGALSGSQSLSELLGAGGSNAVYTDANDGNAEESFYSIGFTAASNDTDGSEELTQVTVAITGLANAGSSVLWNGALITDGEVISVPATLADGTSENILVKVGIAAAGDAATLTLTPVDASGAPLSADSAVQVLSLDLGNLQVQEPQHAADSFSVTATVTSAETDLSGQELTTANNVSHNVTTFTVDVQAVADAATGVAISSVFIPNTESEAATDAGTGHLYVHEGDSITPTFTATFADNDGSETHYLVVEVPTGWTVSAGSGWNAVTDSSGHVIAYSLDVTGQGASVSASGLTFTPVDADTDVDVTIPVHAVSYDSDADGTTAVPVAVTTADVTVEVDAVADATAISAGADYGKDPVTNTPYTAAAPNATVTIAATASFGDTTDGSETHYVLVEVPSGWGTPTVSGVTLAGVTTTDYEVITVSGGSYTDASGTHTTSLGDGTYIQIAVPNGTIADSSTSNTDSASVAVSVTLATPATVSDSSDYAFTVYAQAIETTTADGEPDTSNNVYTSSTSVTVTVDPADVGNGALSGAGQAYEDGDSASGTYTLVNGNLHGYAVSVTLADNASGTEHASPETIVDYTVTNLDAVSQHGALYYTTDGGATYVAVTVDHPTVPGGASLYFVPADNQSDADVTVDVTATIRDADSGATSTTDGTLHVSVDAVADASTITWTHAAEDAVTISYAGQSAGNYNVIGLYTLDSHGDPVFSQILLVDMKTTSIGAELDHLAAGTDPHFFILSNGATAINGLTAAEQATLSFTQDAGGHWVLSYSDGTATHTIPGLYFDNAALSSDGFGHVQVTVTGEGTYSIGFEDLANGGDKDFNDEMLTVTSNSLLVEDNNNNLPVNDSLTVGIGFTAAQTTDTDGSEEVTQVVATLTGLSAETIHEGVVLNYGGSAISFDSSGHASLTVSATVKIYDATTGLFTQTTENVAVTATLTTDANGNPELILTPANASDGTTQVLSLDLSSLSVTMPSDSDDDFTVQVAVTSTETHTSGDEFTTGNNSSTTTSEFSVVIDAAADKPTDVTSSVSTSGSTVTVTATVNGAATAAANAAAWAADDHIAVSAVAVMLSGTSITSVTDTNALTMKAVEAGHGDDGTPYTYPAGFGVSGGSNGSEIDSGAAHTAASEGLKISFSEDTTSVTLHLSVLFGGDNSQYEEGTGETAYAYAYAADGSLIGVYSVNGEDDGTADLKVGNGTTAIDHIILVPADDGVSDFTLSGVSYNLPGTVEEVAGTATLTTSASFDDVIDGSESHYLLVEVPSGWTANGGSVASVSGADNGVYYIITVTNGVVTGAIDASGHAVSDLSTVLPTNLSYAALANGTYVLGEVDNQLHVDGGTASLSVTLKAPNVDTANDITDDYSAKTYAMAVETNPTDTELTLTNNVAVTEGNTLAITVADDVPTVLNAAATLTVDEDGLPGGISNGDAYGKTASSALFNFGHDATGATVAISADTLHSIQVTGLASGATITWSISGGELIGTVNGVVAITVTATSNGVTATLSDNLDHAAGSGDVVISGIQVVGTDGDGDQAVAYVSVAVQDDTPDITAISVGSAGSGNVGQAIEGHEITGNVTIHGGADGIGYLTATIKSDSGTLENSIKMTSSDGTHFSGTANGTTVTYDASSGQWTLTTANVTETAMHTISFTVTDTDGDSYTSGTASYIVTDAVPKADETAVNLTLADGSTAQASNTVTIDFGTDVAGAKVAFADASGHSLGYGDTLTLSGDTAATTVTVTSVSTNSHTGVTTVVARASSGEIVTLTLTPQADADGHSIQATVTAQLTGTDKTFSDLGDNVTISGLQLVGTDGDGDTTTLPVTVTVTDAVPSIGAVVSSDLSSNISVSPDHATLSGTLTLTEGADGLTNTISVKIVGDDGNTYTYSLKEVGTTGTYTANGPASTSGASANDFGKMTLTVNDDGTATWTVAVKDVNTSGSDYDVSYGITFAVTDTDGDTASTTVQALVVDSDRLGGTGGGSGLDVAITGSASGSVLSGGSAAIAMETNTVTGTFDYTSGATLSFSVKDLGTGTTETFVKDNGASTSDYAVYRTASGMTLTVDIKGSDAGHWTLATNNVSGTSETYAVTFVSTYDTQIWVPGHFDGWHWVPGHSQTVTSSDSGTVNVVVVDSDIAVNTSGVTVAMTEGGTASGTVTYDFGYDLTHSTVTLGDSAGHALAAGDHLTVNGTQVAVTAISTDPVTGITTITTANGTIEVKLTTVTDGDTQAATLTVVGGTLLVTNGELTVSGLTLVGTDGDATNADTATVPVTISVADSVPTITATVASDTLMATEKVGEVTGHLTIGTGADHIAHLTATIDGSDAITMSLTAAGTYVGSDANGTTVTYDASSGQWTLVPGNENGSFATHTVAFSVTDSDGSTTTAGDSFSYIVVDGVPNITSVDGTHGAAVVAANGNGAVIGGGLTVDSTDLPDSVTMTVNGTAVTMTGTAHTNADGSTTFTYGNGTYSVTLSNSTADPYAWTGTWALEVASTLAAAYVVSFAFTDHDGDIGSTYTVTLTSSAPDLSDSFGDAVTTDSGSDHHVTVDVGLSGGDSYQATLDHASLALSSDGQDLTIDTSVAHSGTLTLTALNGDNNTDSVSFLMQTLAHDDTSHTTAANPLNADSDADHILIGSENGDVINGGAGNDIIYGLGGNDLIHGGAGNDTIYGGDGNDTLYGDAGNDHLIGGAGDDVLIGGAGNDVLTGGDGADTFKYTAEDATAIANNVSDHDTITDFNVDSSHGAVDSIDLDALFEALGANDSADKVAVKATDATGTHFTVSLEDGAGNAVHSDFSITVDTQTSTTADDLAQHVQAHDHQVGPS